MTNKEVVYQWFWGNRASAKNLSTDGKDLFSYGLRIGFTPDWRKIAIDYTATGKHFVSQTTSHHVAIAKRFADATIAPDLPR